MSPRDGRWAALLLVALAACDPAGQTPPPSGATTTASQPAAASSATSSASTRSPQAVYADEDLPVAADFEAAADKEITEANYLDELRAIEAELGVAPKTDGDAGASP